MLLLAAAPEELGELEGAVVGVGPVVAAVETTRLLLAHKPDSVVLIGTGGAYAGGPPIDTAIVATEVALSWGVAAMGLGYVPRPPGPVECDTELVEALGLPQHRVLTVGAITTDPKLASRISDGYSVEHLEAFGVAHACRVAGVPFTAVLGISNLVGPDAHVQWLSHRDTAQAAARAAVRPLLQG